MTTIIDAINDHYEATNVPRTHLGLSQAGHACSRFLWYAHAGFPGKQPEGRVLRLFQLGNILETQTIQDLQAAGYSLTRGQEEVALTLDGITLTGHIDGVLNIDGVDHLFEHKTASNKKFNQLLKSNSYAIWNPSYFWQLQAYCLGLDLEYAAVFVYNKDNSELYFEKLPFDRVATLGKIADVFKAIGQPTPPERLCPRVDCFESLWCNHHEVCWHG